MGTVGHQLADFFHADLCSLLQNSNPRSVLWHLSIWSLGHQVPERHWADGEPQAQGPPAIELHIRLCSETSLQDENPDAQSTHR